MNKSNKRCYTKPSKHTYLVVVAFGVAAVAVLALVALSLVDARNQVRLEVFSEVAFLRELFQAEVALVRLDASVHARVVENVPRARELFVAAVEPANVDGLRLVFTVDISEYSFVVELFEQLEVDVALGHLFVELHARAVESIDVCITVDRCVTSEVSRVVVGFGRLIDVSPSI